MRLPLFTAAGDQLRQWQTRGLEETIGQVAAATIKTVTPSLTKRASSSTCAANDTSAACQRPSDTTNMQTVAIALGVGIPLGCAAIVLFFLHRRHLKRQRLEDLNDPHKSLDFGMGYPGSSKGKGKGNRKGGPEMSVADLGDDPSSTRRLRGLSMDMGSPYLLPGELQGSRASLRSMSRSMHSDSDPYRPVTLIKNDHASNPAMRMGNDKGSVRSAATSMQSSQEHSGLIANAGPMSHSVPKRADSMSPYNTTSTPPPPPPSTDEMGHRQLKSALRNTSTPSRKNSAGSHSTDKVLPNIAGMPPQSVDLKNFTPPPPPPPPKEDSPLARPPRSSSVSAGSTVGLPPRKSSIAGSRPVPSIVVPSPQTFGYGDGVPSLPPITHHSFDPTSEYDINPALIYTDRHSLDEIAPSGGLAAPSQQNNRLSVMGMRPLPTDLPEDNPEQRANRIRSFYKEYFDDSRPNPQGQYMDDHDASYLADYAIYDPSNGGFVTSSKPFAQPIARRAMTPPPRGGAAPSPFGPHRRHLSTQSAARFAPRGRNPLPQKTQLPPPSPLVSLPTPHKLKDDFGIFNALDFAPPTSFRDRQAGRAPDSPLGVQRPYSPSVAPFTPLAGAYDELAAVPSPHLLRKSGTFTALDFAPPPRLRDQGTASDAGSIRSNRSGISAMQQEAIRAGAYRVSRIPTDMVSTKDDIANQLKPRWEMRVGDNVMG